MAFQTSTPFTDKDTMKRVVRELEAGFKPNLPGPALPRGYVLTEVQRSGLREIVRLVLIKTVAAVAKNPALRPAVLNQMRQARFRFLDQVPDAKAALQEALLPLRIELD